jgi:hypothetical protein
VALWTSGRWSTWFGTTGRRSFTRPYPWVMPWGWRRILCASGVRGCWRTLTRGGVANHPQRSSFTGCDSGSYPPAQG